MSDTQLMDQGDTHKPFLAMNVVQLRSNDCKVIVNHDKWVFLQSPRNKNITDG